MEDCCEVTPEAMSSCPRCGRPGRNVGRITVEAMLRPEPLARLTDADHRFCATPDCPVVYFGLADRFQREDIGVPVWQKEPAGARTVCYCFAITEDDISREQAAGGRSTVVERIAALVRDGRCACEVENPQGSCCLGNLAAVVRSAEEGARREAGGVRQIGAAGAAMSGAGAALVATAAAACCAGPVVAPLVVAVLGASGAAWAAGLKPYSPWLLGGSLLLLVYGFWSTYRIPNRCRVQTGRRRRWGSTAVRVVLWLAAILWLAAVTVNLFLGG